MEMIRSRLLLLAFGLTSLWGTGQHLLKSTSYESDSLKCSFRRTRAHLQTLLPAMCGL